MQLSPYALQPLLLTHPAAAPLYARVEGPVLFSADQKTATLGKNAVLDLDAFFGSFYESAWQETTGLENFSLAFDLNGTVKIQLFRQTQGLPATPLLEVPLYGKGDRVDVAIPPKTDGPPSRLYARFVAQEDQVTIGALSWGTKTPPPFPVLLAVVICTMDRDADVARALTTLAPARQQGPVQSVIVINQGAPNLSDRLAQLVPADIPLPHVIDQANLGGSGGFARGMMESVALPDITHVLLMDDDVAFDAAMVIRLGLLLGYTPPTGVIGGFMLDALQPCLLHNAVGRLDAQKLKVVPPIANTDLAPRSASDLFLDDTRGDFCGWWCAAMSRTSLEKGGLPLPFFLHYDDVAYGIRQKKAGITHRLWPGLAVWHEPFYVKVSAWRRYYDFRNVLCLLALYGPLEKGVVLRGLWARFFMNTRQKDYASAVATLDGMRDFLRAPQILPHWGAAAHQRLIAYLKHEESPPSLGHKMVLYARLACESLRFLFSRTADTYRTKLIACTTAAAWRARFTDNQK